MKSKKKLTLLDILQAEETQYEEYCSEFINRVGSNINFHIYCETICPLKGIDKDKEGGCKPFKGNVKEVIIKKFPSVFLEYLEKQDEK